MPHHWKDRGASVRRGLCGTPHRAWLKICQEGSCGPALGAGEPHTALAQQAQKDQLLCLCFQEGPGVMPSAFSRVTSAWQELGHMRSLTAWASAALMLTVGQQARPGASHSHTLSTQHCPPGPRCFGQKAPFLLLLMVEGSRNHAG